MDNQKTEDYSALDKLGLVASRAFVAVDKRIRETVRSDHMLALYAPTGTGKSTALDISIGRMTDSGRTFIMRTTAYNPGADISGSIINIMIGELMQQKPRRDILARLTQLKGGLLEHSRKKKIVLVIDEAQDMHHQTLYAIKKLHELGSSVMRRNLFSVILSGKPGLQNLITAEELNFRFGVHEMQPLSKAEAVDYFRMRRVKFPNPDAMERIIHRCGTRPAALDSACNLLLAMSGEDKITGDIVKNYLRRNYRPAMAELGMSDRKVADEIYAATGMRYSPSTINKITNGHTVGSKDDVVLDAVADVLSKRRQEVQNKQTVRRQAG
ncbi:MAG: ATP-binding protein [Spirochaetes bacterium]|nr:ATP-binding protein [Spirochaetota bacterium]